MGPIIGCQLAFKYMGKSNGGKGGMVINTASIAGKWLQHNVSSILLLLYLYVFPERKKNAPALKHIPVICL